VSRRTVRVTPELFRQLDRNLHHERGPRGEPTPAELAASDLLDIVDAFAGLWDSLPELIPGRSDYRVLILTTRLVPHVTVTGQLSPVDGAIELTKIRLDFEGLPDPDEHDQDDQYDGED
jgi:hypothetical protein